MTEKQELSNEPELKALALIAAELHIHNYISIADKTKRLKLDFSYLSEENIPKLVDHFIGYFKGGRFSPGGSGGLPSPQARR
jgi:hypothetical protein